MNDPQLDPVDDRDESLAVLAAYRAQHAVYKQTDPEHSGWVDRLTTVADIEVDELSGIHGKLIACGLLEFQLTGRTTGVQYQLSSAGAKMLESASVRSDPAQVDGQQAA